MAYEGQTTKYKDTETAKTVWPVFLACSGSARKTHEKLDADGIEISRPTLNKLIDYFGFVAEREKHIKAQVNKTVATNSESEIHELLAEVTEQKNAVHKMIVDCPTDMAAHKLYGDYIGQIINLRKQIIAAQQVNKDLLLADALTAVVKVLLEGGQQEAAEAVEQNLETITGQVQEKWRKQT